MPTTPRTPVRNKPRSGVSSAGPTRRAVATKTAVQPSDITYAKKLVDPSLFWQDEQAAEFHFRLAATFPDREVYVKAQRVTLGDEILDGRFPAEFTDELFKGLEFIADASNRGKLDALNAASDVKALRMAAQMPHIRPVLDAAIVLGFIEPKAYLSEEEAKANGGIPVSKLRFADKIRFVGELRGEDAAADALFPPAPQPEA